MSGRSHTLSAAFLGSEGQNFLTVKFQPTAAPRGHIVYLPPFGEEMNRCRALAAEQARRFADAGYICTMVDFFGTGDSEGELHEASFSVWQDNIRLAIESGPESPGLPLTLWGMRLGGLHALLFAGRSALPVQNLILWQPVTSGKRYVTQLLRQRVASLVGKDLPAETTQEIRQRLEEGENVEVSGYLLGGELVRDMESADPFSAGKLCRERIFWLENTPEPGQEMSTAAAKVVQKLEQQGNTVDVYLFNDPPLWQLHKRDEAPGLLAITEGLLS